MTDRSSQHWYPTAAYLTLHLDGPALAGVFAQECYRRDGYAGVASLMRRRPGACACWKIPAWMRRTSLGSRSRCRGAAIPRRRPTTRCAYLRVLAHSWAQATDPRRQAPGARIALARCCVRHSHPTWKMVRPSLRHTRLRHPCATARSLRSWMRYLPQPWPRLWQQPAPPHARRAAGTAYLASARRDLREPLLARGGRRSVGADAVAADWHKDSALRVRRLVRRGDELMHGGYRRLAQLPMFRHWGRFSTLCESSLSKKPCFLESALSGRVVWPG